MGLWTVAIWLAMHVVPPPLITSVSQLTGVDRTKADFYGAIATPGTPLRTSWKLTPGEPATLALHITGAMNPHELDAPPLLNIPEFDVAFIFLGDAVKRDDVDGVMFDYPLRPRQPGKRAIPELKYAYFLPGANRFQATYTEAIAWEDPPAKPLPDDTPINGPPEFFNWRSATSESVLRAARWLWWAVPLSLIVLTAVVVMLHRRFLPDAARLAKLSRVRAVRIALKQLKSSRGTLPELRVVLLGYLRSRHGLTRAATTPAEVRAALAPTPLAESAADLLGELHASQFSPPPADTRLSVATIREQILRWEEQA